jgi:hypothetical protein
MSEKGSHCHRRWGNSVDPKGWRVWRLLRRGRGMEEILGAKGRVVSWGGVSAIWHLSEASKEQASLKMKGPSLVG